MAETRNTQAQPRADGTNARRISANLPGSFTPYRRDPMIDSQSEHILNLEGNSDQEDPQQQDEEIQNNGKMAMTGAAMSGAGKMLSKTGLGAGAGASLQAAGNAMSTIKNPLKAAQDKFGVTTVYLMIGTAIFFDVLIAIVDLLDLVTFGLASILFGSIFDMLAGMTFWLWFKVKGAKFGKRRSLSLLGGFVAKFIPIIDLFPDWTIAILLSFFEESLENIVAGVPGAGIAIKALDGKSTG